MKLTAQPRGEILSFTASFSALRFLLAIFDWLINYGTVLNAGNARRDELSVLTIKFYVLDRFEKNSEPGWCLQQSFVYRGIESKLIKKKKSITKKKISEVKTS